MKLNLPLKRGDYIVVAAVLLISAVLFGISLITSRGEGRLYVQVVCGGESSVYPLWEPRTLELEGNGYTAELVIEDGCADMTFCDCPDQVCVNTRAVSSVGECIVCAPAAIVVKIVSDGGKDADFIAG